MMETTSEDRRKRREAFNRLAAEDLTALDTLTLEYASLHSGNPLTADNIRLRLFRIAEVFGITEFPRGYKIYGIGTKTGPYVCIGNSSARAKDDQLVSDAITGLLTEIAEMLEKKIAFAKKANIPVTEGK